MYCKQCGTEIDGKFCHECGTPTNGEINPKEAIPEKNLDNSWYVVSIIIPLLGVIGGLYYISKGYKNAPMILLIGLIAWMIYMMIYFVF